jgi:segregation and condensation protein B
VARGALCALFWATIAPNGVPDLEIPSSVASHEDGWLSVADAARRLKLDRSRVYALVRSGELQGINDPVAGMRINPASVEHRRGLGDVAGSPLTPANAWLAIALASGDPLFEAHVVDQVRPAMLPRIRARLDHDGLLAMAPRLRSRAAKHQLTVSPARAAELAADPALVRTGPSAAAAYGWSDLLDLPPDVYVPPPLVAEVLASPEPGPSEAGTVVWLRVVTGAWPFPPQRAIAPAALAALDLLDHPVPAGQHQAREVLAGLDELRATTLLRRDTRARWRGALSLVRRASRDERTPASLLPPRASVADLLVDDAAVAVHMVAVLHAAGSGDVSRAELADALDVPAERVDAGWAYLGVRPPPGLLVQRHAEHFRLVTDKICTASVERYLKRSQRPQPLSQPQREALAIVAYAQPVSRARIDEIRGSNSDAAVGFLLQRGLLTEQRPRRDAPAVLETTPECLAYLGLASLDELPRLQAIADVALADTGESDDA